MHTDHNPTHPLHSPFVDVGGQPLQTLVETITRGSARSLDVPCPLSERLQTKLVSDLGGIHGVREILLVGKDKK